MTQTLSEGGVISIEEAARRLTIGRTLAYELARSGRFPVPIIHLGRLYKVPVAALEKLLAGDVEADAQADATAGAIRAND